MLWAVAITKEPAAVDSYCGLDRSNTLPEPSRRLFGFTGTGSRNPVTVVPSPLIEVYLLPIAQDVKYIWPVDPRTIFSPGALYNKPFNVYTYLQRWSRHLKLVQRSPSFQLRDCLAPCLGLVPRFSEL